ncbi:lytic transglycosylase domain-containing protein [Burkholderia pyrrocinia]|uniref:lytic transglycosylase domain-containing protein n=1 Tax=Burkholderia pyrrocinia TaxID=60550 RepID=UPI001046ACFA|nr:lytic transglycosylase domain-containing protein [Burkholderia pyrrocinia]TDA47464.1 lytic transglycosylase domain-containing protein [Burkholderia pyrrocinia]
MNRAAIWRARSTRHIPLRAAALAVALAIACAGPAHATGGRGVAMIVGGMQPDEPAVPPLKPAAERPVAADDGRAIPVVRAVGPQDLSGAMPGIRTVSAHAQYAQRNANTRARVMALAPIVDEAAQKSMVDGALLMAVIHVESGGNPLAVSRKGATGLMQLMPDTGAEMGALDLFDQRQNVIAGARFLGNMMRRYGSVDLALAAYNAGPGAVDRHGYRIPPFKETQDYVVKVNQQYDHYRHMRATEPGESRPVTVATLRGGD